VVVIRDTTLEKEKNGRHEVRTEIKGKQAFPEQPIFRTVWLAAARHTTCMYNVADSSSGLSSVMAYLRILVVLVVCFRLKFLLKASPRCIYKRSISASTYHLFCILLLAVESAFKDHEGARGTSVLEK
jgi:hypothetical protein